MNTPLSGILLATYGSERTEFAAHTAIRLANSADCELHLVYVERLRTAASSSWALSRR
jgi:nucleotide-binding universal stress UspA family protein